MPRLTAEQWRVIAKSLRFVGDICDEKKTQPILDVIGEQGEKAALAPTPEEPTRENH